MDTYIDHNGYERLKKFNRKRRTISYHVVLVEKILGKPLPKGAIVHHANGIPSDNRPCNLVVCPDQKYHTFLHVRMRAKKECGNANWRKCPFCKQHDDPENMVPHKSQSYMYHRECINKRERDFYKNNPDKYEIKKKRNNKANRKRKIIKDID